VEFQRGKSEAFVIRVQTLLGLALILIPAEYSMRNVLFVLLAFPLIAILSDMIIFSFDFRSELYA